MVTHLARCSACLAVVDEILHLKAALIQIHGERESSRLAAGSADEAGLGRLHSWVGAGGFRGDSLD